MTTPSYNLLREPWLPVRTKSGALRWIRPCEMIDSTDPPLYIDSPRPDFNGALTQFLIGLVQTCLAPEDEEAWLDVLDEPLTSAQLNGAFEPFIAAFELFGDGPRFMQDLEGFEADECAALELMIEIPAGNTLAKNADLFVKRTASGAGLSPAAAAAALLTLQLNAPSGGVGYRTSIRGGGPLTTLLLGQDLWQTVWLNTLPQDTFNAIHKIASPPQELSAIFPWLTSTRDSQAVSKGGLGLDTTPQDVHPLQLYWAMPRRIRLLKPQAQGDCALYQQQSPLVTAFIQTNYGTNYTGPWQHPLSPYTIKEQDRISRKGQPRCLEFRHWPALTCIKTTKDESQRLAEPLRCYLSFSESQRRHIEALRQPLKLWVFGYDMDNAKVRNWYEGAIPTLATSDEGARVALERLARQLIDVAALVQDVTIQAVQRAMFGDCNIDGAKPSWRIQESAQKSKTFLESIALELWQSAEADFYQTLADALARDIFNDADAMDVLKRGWLNTLAKLSASIFESRTPANINNDSDLRARTIAADERWRFIAPSAKNIQTALGLLT